MKLTFYKYQGTGNDFVIMDNRDLVFPKSDTLLVARLCDRKYGIGADGLILLENDDVSDFKMIYYNSDGNQSTMCGNGGRCIVAFAKFMGVIKNETSFNAVDGLHRASITNGSVSLQMKDVDNVQQREKYVFLDTGSPHHVQMVTDLENFAVAKEGAKLRYGIYGEKGSNINFVHQQNNDTFSVRTYERGVEDETLSCGTGVTAVALAMYHLEKTTSDHITVKTLGGDLNIAFKVQDSAFKEIFLTGPAKQVFKGEIDADT